MTWGELIAQARFLLQDTDPSRYRYPQDKLMAACHFACLTAKGVRPDLFFNRILAEGDASVCFPAPPYTESELFSILAKESPFPEIYHSAAVNFTAGYAEMINEEYSSEGRAVALMNSFASQLSGRPA